jgi:hypothetical protein
MDRVTAGAGELMLGQQDHRPDARVIHQPPALIQDRDWRPQYQSPSIRIATDPVLEVALTFYNDQLFRITITY